MVTGNRGANTKKSRQDTRPSASNRSELPAAQSRKQLSQKPMIVSPDEMIPLDDDDDEFTNF